MLVRNRKALNLGLFFTVSFVGVLLMIFSPVFGGKNGLEFADESFNKLAKGSSYFIPKVRESVAGLSGRPISLTLRMDGEGEAVVASDLLVAAGLRATLNGSEVMVEGELGGLLAAALEDADAMYHNNGRSLADRYGYDERKVLGNWWMTLSKMEKALKKKKLLKEADGVSLVLKKAVEPSYNFYRTEPERVSDHAGMMSGLLVFYVAYTMWWGYAIFYIFEGIGLSMRKSRVKKEV
ncbi:MAG: hypothetical protein Kow0025_11710 [Thermodesulfovibrionales bacterium]